MMFDFRGQTADEAWLAAAEAFRDHWRVQAGRGGATHELLHASFEVRSPRDRWVLSRTPPISPAACISEVVWILRGRDDARLVNFWNPKMPRYAGGSPTYYGAYGFRLRRNHDLDQITRAYQALSSNPDTRQVCLAIWDPVRDLPEPSGEPRALDIPCNIVSMLKLREGRLEWTQVMRSNDFWRGLPVNFVQFTCLQEIIAGWLGVEVGTYCHWSDSLHLYEDALPHLQEVVAVPIPRSTDSLALPKKESDALFAEIERRLDLIVAGQMTELGFRRLADVQGFPDGYRNLLLVAFADAARRMKWPDLASQLMETCSNQVLSLAWQRWVARVERA